MSLFTELESIESSPDYQALPPEERADVLRGWQAQSTGKPELDDVRKQVASAALDERNSFLRAKMPINPLTGALRELPPRLSEVIKSPDWSAVEDPETRKDILRGWSKAAADTYEGVPLNAREAEQAYADLILAEKTLAGEDGDPSETQKQMPALWRADVAEMQTLSKTPLFVKGRVKYEKGAAVVADDGKYEINPTEALRPEAEYFALVDSLPDASNEDKLRLKGTYRYRKQAAYANIVDTMKKAQYVAAAQAQPGQTSFDPRTMDPSIILNGQKIPFKDISEVVLTPQREAQYDVTGGEQEGLFSPDPAVRKEAEKRTALQFARHILPAAGQASLAMSVAQNPEGPEAKELVESHRDYLKSTLWVSAPNIKNNTWEKVRVLSDGSVAVSPAWARTFPEDIDDVAKSAGVPGKASEIRKQVEESRLAQALYLIANAGAINSDFDPFVAKMKKNGVTDPVEIMRAWDAQYGILDNINAGLMTAVRQTRDISTGLLGLVASAMPENQGLQQYVADRAAASQVESELESALAGSNKSDLIQGLAAETPWIALSLLGVAPAMRSARLAAVTQRLEPAARAAMARSVSQAARVAAAAPDMALMSSKDLAAAGQAAGRAYFGLQAGRSFGGMYTEAYNAMFEEAQKGGLDMQAAQRTASLNALLPAVSAGLATGYLMKLMPGGTEAAIEELAKSSTIGTLRKRFGADAVRQAFASKEFSRNAYQYVSGILNKGGLVKALGRSIGAGVVGATKEGIEEATDEAFQAYLTSTFDPRLTLREAMERVVTAGYLGAVISGSMSAVSNFRMNRQTAETLRNEKAKQSDLSAEADNLEQEGDTATADTLREAAGASPLLDILNTMVGTAMTAEEIGGIVNSFAIVSSAMERDAADQLAAEITASGKEVDVTVVEDATEAGKFRVRVAEAGTDEETDEEAPPEAATTPAPTPTPTPAPDAISKEAETVLDSDRVEFIRREKENTDLSTEEGTLAAEVDPYYTVTATGGIVPVINKDGVVAAKLTPAEQTAYVNKAQRLLDIRKKQAKNLEWMSEAKLTATRTKKKEESKKPAPPVEEADNIPEPDMSSQREAAAKFSPASAATVTQEDADEASEATGKFYDMVDRALKAALKVTRAIDASYMPGQRMAERTRANIARYNKILKAAENGDWKAFKDGIDELRKTVRKKKDWLTGSKENLDNALRTYFSIPDAQTVDEYFDAGKNPDLDLSFKENPSNATAEAFVAEKRKKQALASKAADIKAARAAQIEANKNKRKQQRATQPTSRQELESVTTEPIPVDEMANLEALPDDAAVEDIAAAAPKLIEQSKALALKFKDFASWSSAATKSFGSGAVRFLETIWNGLRSISIAAIIGYTTTGIDAALAPTRQEIAALPKEDAISAAYILPETSPKQEAVVLRKPEKIPVEVAKPPVQKTKTIKERVDESLSFFDPEVSNYVNFYDKGFETEILNSVNPTAPMLAVAPLIGETEGNRTTGANKTLAKVFEIGGLRGSQDEIPWCAMFISHGLNKAGIPTRNVMASQFLSFGKKTTDPKVGDIVVFNKRNDDDTISKNTAGHVGFFIRESNGFIIVLNGNVGDKAGVTALPKRRVMQYRSSPDQTTKESLNADVAIRQTQPTSRQEEVEEARRLNDEELDAVGGVEGLINSISDVLRSIAAKTPRLKPLIDGLLSQGDITVDAIEVIDDPDAAPGWFDPDLRKIVFNRARRAPRGAQDTIVHEVTHYVLDEYIERDWPEGSPQAEAINEILAVQKAYQTRLMENLESYMRLVNIDPRLSEKMAEQGIAPDFFRYLSGLYTDSRDHTVRMSELHAAIASKAFVTDKYRDDLTEDESFSLYMEYDLARTGYDSVADTLRDQLYALGYATDGTGAFRKDAFFANGISKEFLTHMVTDPVFQGALDTLISENAPKPIGFRRVIDAFRTLITGRSASDEQGFAASIIEKLMRVEESPLPPSPTPATTPDAAQEGNLAEDSIDQRQNAPQGGTATEAGRGDRSRKRRKKKKKAQQKGLLNEDWANGNAEWKRKPTDRLNAWERTPSKGNPDTLSTGFLTGKHSTTIADAASSRNDLGLLVTPVRVAELKHAAKYSFIGIDNGVFGKNPFDETKFRELIRKVASDSTVKERTLFVVAPDVIGDAEATLNQFTAWANEIRSLGLPVALAGQDGLENMIDRIPWGLVDVFFIGGSTDWKLGNVAEQNKNNYFDLFEQFHIRGIPIHMGRANTAERIAGVAQTLGVSTADGTTMAYAPDTNLKNITDILESLNKKGEDYGAMQFQELGRAPALRELYDLAMDASIEDESQLGAYAPARGRINRIRKEAGMPLIRQAPRLTRAAGTHGLVFPEGVPSERAAGVFGPIMTRAAAALQFNRELPAIQITLPAVTIPTEDGADILEGTESPLSSEATHTVEVAPDAMARLLEGKETDEDIADIGDKLAGVINAEVSRFFGEEPGRRYVLGSAAARPDAPWTSAVTDRLSDPIRTSLDEVQLTEVNEMYTGITSDTGALGVSDALDAEPGVRMAVTELLQSDFRRMLASGSKNEAAFADVVSALAQLSREGDRDASSLLGMTTVPSSQATTQLNAFRGTRSRVASSPGAFTKGILESPKKALAVARELARAVAASPGITEADITRLVSADTMPSFPGDMAILASVRENMRALFPVLPAPRTATLEKIADGVYQDKEQGVEYRYTRPVERFSIPDAITAIRNGDPNTPFRAINEAIEDSIEYRGRVLAESQRRARPRAAGKAAIRNQLANAIEGARLENRNLPEEFGSAVMRFLETIPENYLLDTSLGFSSRAPNSTYDFGEDLVTFATRISQNPEQMTHTALHEFYHGLSRFLPDQEVRKMKNDYLKAVKAYVKENPWFVAFIGRKELTEQQYEDMQQVFSPKELAALPIDSLSLNEFGQPVYRLKFTRENYRLMRLDEWIVENLADQMQRKLERPATMFERIARLLRDFFDMLREALGNPYLRSIEMLSNPRADLDMLRGGPVEPFAPVMYGGPAVGDNNQFVLGMYADQQPSVGNSMLFNTLAQMHTTIPGIPDSEVLGFSASGEIVTVHPAEVELPTEQEWREFTGAGRTADGTYAVRDTTGTVQRLPDVRFTRAAGSVTPEEDAEYLAAVEAGDMERAQRLVDEAAKRAGFTIPANHTSPNKFTVFNRRFRTEVLGMPNLIDESVIWFRKGEGKAKYGPATYNVFLKLEDPWKIEGKTVGGENGWHNFARTVEAIANDKNPETFVSYMKKQKWDGVEITNVNLDFDRFTVYGVFDPNQIKSADPVTYDDAGNVIPLSTRFNSESSDIRYTRAASSVTPEEDALHADLERRYRAGDEAAQDEAQGMINQLASTSDLPKIADGNAYKIYRGKPPKKTFKAYKKFSTVGGYPQVLFVGGNDNLPVGVWLDAVDPYHFTDDSGNMRVPTIPARKLRGGKMKSETMGKSTKIPNQKVRDELIARGYLKEGSNAKSVATVAYRPGWHMAQFPVFPQGGREFKKPERFYDNINNANDVYYEVEVDDTNTAYWNEKAQRQQSKDLKEMPTDGAYRYYTNPRKDIKIGDWFIGGRIKIVRALSEGEVNSILDENNVPRQGWDAGEDEAKLAELDLDVIGVDPSKTQANGKLKEPFTYDDNGNLIPLSQRFNPESSDIRYTRPRSRGRVTSPLWKVFGFKGRQTERAREQRLRDLTGVISGMGYYFNDAGKWGSLATVYRRMVAETEAAVEFATRWSNEMRSLQEGLTPDVVDDVNLLLGNQDNVYDAKMEADAREAYRKARRQAARKYNARMKAAGALPSAQKARLQADASLDFTNEVLLLDGKLSTDLIAAAQAGLLVFQNDQNAARARLIAGKHEDLVRSADRMRSRLNDLAATIVKVNGSDPHLVATFDSRKGIHLSRYYQMHDDPSYADWLASPDPEAVKLRTAAYNYIKSARMQSVVQGYLQVNKGATLAQATSYANAYFARIGNAPIVRELDDFIAKQMRGGGTSTKGLINASILLEKSGIPAPLRDLLGQYRNNTMVAARTAMEMGIYHANHTFLKGIVEHLSKLESDRQARVMTLSSMPTRTAAQNEELADLRSIMFLTSDSKEAATHGLTLFQPSHTRISHKALGPLATFYGPAHIVEAIQELQPNMGGAVVDAYSKILGLALKGATSLNVRGQVRNFLTNIAFIPGTGYIPAMTAMLDVKNRALGKDLEDRVGARIAAIVGTGVSEEDAKRQAALEFARFYAEAGIAAGSDLDTLIKDINSIAGIGLDQSFINMQKGLLSKNAAAFLQTGTGVLAKADRLASEQYRRTDDFFKKTIFENLYGGYAKAFGLKFQGGELVMTPAAATEIIKAYSKDKLLTTLEDRELGSDDIARARLLLLRHSAKATRVSIPYYDQLPEFVNILKRSKLGLVAAPFVSWPAAIIQNSWRTPSMVAKDWSVPATKKMAIRRAVGTSLTTLLWGTLMNTIMKGVLIAASYMFGDKEDPEAFAPDEFSFFWSEREKALLDLLPDYYKYRDISVLGMYGDNPVWVDLSWMNPYATLRDLVMPLLHPRAFETGFNSWESIKEIGGKVARLVINPQLPISAAYEALTEQDYEIQNASDIEKIRIAVGGVASSVLPATFGDIGKIYQARGTEKMIPSIVNILGIKTNVLDVEDRFRKAIRRTDRMDDELGQKLRKLYRDGDVRQIEDLEDVYEKAMENRQELYLTLYQQYESASMLLGSRASKILVGDEGRRLGQDNLRALRSGRVPAIQMSEMADDQAKAKDRREGTNRVQLMRQLTRQYQGISLWDQ